MFNPTIILSCLIFSLHVLIIQSQINNSYGSRCSPFNCGLITFRFPFSDLSTFGSGGPINCGFPGYQITCYDQESFQVPRFMLSGRLYEVKNIFFNESVEGGVNLITLVDTDLIRDFTTRSCQSLRYLTITATDFPNNHALDLPPWTTNLTFFKCPSQLQPSQDFLDQIAFDYSCHNEGYKIYLWRSVIRSPARPILPKFNHSLTPRGCNLVMVPVSSTDMIIMVTNVSSVANGGIETSQLTKALDAGFPLQWNSSDDCDSCNKTNRRCGYDGTRVICLCQDGCLSTKPKLSQLQKVIIGVACGSCSIVVIVVILLVYKKRASLIFTTHLKKNPTTSDVPNAKAFIQTYRSNLLNNYSYNDIKKMTNGFKDKLGEGGYGNVYRGKLFDGRIIAVKLLKSADIISDNFMTEVATIGTIHHFNVINLLGFCWDGSKKALIYEYMSNGSLADLLLREEANQSVGVAKLIEIAIGVAEGIEYLHNGCESRILHLDIKPQNVLLDQNLNPKISDFGLAKVYSRNQSNVTMTAARGTIGYIAPEIFMRNLGNPSHKSDVYSYGMLLLEMVGGGKQRFKPVTSSDTSSTEAYFPGWIYEKLMEERKMMLQSDFVEEESHTITRKMIMVGLWCIQINQRDRPSMKGVVEMLSGRMEDIEMPPQPLFMFSLPRQEIFENEIASVGSDSSVIPLTHDQSLEIHKSERSSLNEESCGNVEWAYGRH